MRGRTKDQRQGQTLARTEHRTNERPFQATMHRATQKEKTQRAFRAYLDLLDTAEYMLSELQGQLMCYDLTINGFRMLELLYRTGPMRMADAARERRYNRQNLDVVVKRLEERGWVRRENSTLPPAERKPSHIPWAKRDRPRAGRRVTMVRLTPQGEKFIGVVFPNHAKIVKALMRAIDSREQESLSRICRKLREGDVVRYISELMHLEVDE
jgi:MarR family 2-MHQ and catechol resistance regulon transcriptional repressor